MKKIIVSIVIIVVLLAAGFWIFSYYSNPRVVSSESTPTTSCTSTDGNNINVAGMESYTYQGEDSQKTIRDFCNYYEPNEYSYVGTLRETYCANNSLVTDIVKCGRGSVCRAGRCVEGSKSLPICNDSDGGLEPKVLGEINVGVAKSDGCWMSPNKSNPTLDGGFGSNCSGGNCYTYEYYCGENDQEAYKLIPSPQGCVDGVQK